MDLKNKVLAELESDILNGRKRSTAQIASAVGCSNQTVLNIKHDLGFLRKKEEKHMTVKDILISSSGCDDEGTPCSGVALKTFFYSADEVETNVVENILDNAEVNIFRSASYTTIDLIFPRASAIDLKVAYKQLTKIQTADNSVDETTCPMITITIVPREYAGRAFVIGLNPIMWSLQPDENGKVRILRFAFAEEDLIVGSSDYELDFAAVEKEVEEDNLALEEINRMEAERQEKRRAYNEKMFNESVGAVLTGEGDDENEEC